MSLNFSKQPWFCNKVVGGVELKDILLLLKSWVENVKTKQNKKNLFCKENSYVLLMWFSIKLLLLLLLLIVFSWYHCFKVPFYKTIKNEKANIPDDQASLNRFFFLFSILLFFPLWVGISLGSRWQFPKNYKRCFGQAKFIHMLNWDYES